MSVDISDMLAFVNKLAKLNVPYEYENVTVSLNNLADDVPECFGKVFDDDVKVKKVRGV